MKKSKFSEHQIYNLVEKIGGCIYVGRGILVYQNKEQA